MNNNIARNNNMSMSMPYAPESDEDEELSESYINDGDCSGGASGGSNSDNNSTKSSTSSSSSALSDDDNESTSNSDDDETSSQSDDDATTTQSNELELAQLTDEHTFRLPRGLCESATIFNEFFSLETWNMLPQSMQAQLVSLLPKFEPLLTPDLAAEELQRTIVDLFNGDIERFGQGPLEVLQRQLEDGSLRPDVLQLRRSIEHSKRRERRFQQYERLSQLAKELFISREHLLRNVYTAPPDSALYSNSRSARSRKRKPPTLQMNSKFLAQRARKRYCLELYELTKELDLQPDDISADEQDEDAIKAAELAAIEQEWAPVEVGNGGALAAKPSNAADKKCIYSTFFKRRHGVDDEHVLRTMQAAKIPRLNDKNFKKYLRDYKRRKLAEPDLPDFDTTDIRLRDICTRAQFVGTFRPGRKPKALTARLTEPPALVPIGAAKCETPQSELLTDEPQQVYGRAAIGDDDEDDDEGLDLDSLGYDAAITPTTTPQPKLTPASKPLPKLEPIGVRAIGAVHSPGRPKGSLNPSPHKALIKGCTINTTTATTHITGSPTREQQPTILSSSSESSQQSSFFSLLRDFFVATPNHRMTYAELQTMLVAWKDNNVLSGTPSSTSNDWYRALPDWTVLLQSGINFLSGDFAALPAEYVPYIEHKTQLNIYQWIGAGRDSDARLLTLCNYWLQRRKDFKEHTPTHSPRALGQSLKTSPRVEGQVVVSNALLSPVESIGKVPVDNFALLASPTPPPRCPTSWTVRTATQAETLEFQRQERLRFEQPHRPFTYRMHGYESVVGPVKGIYTQTFSLNKARGHTVMVDDRPPYVTILTLVRDATARLPNGEGTRAEISELLKCSQYINHNAAENVLQTIVSGALDRMHGGLDPCVRYDAKRKIWIYLHRNRSEDEFERMHKHNQSLVKKQQHKVQRAKGKPKKEGELGIEQAMGSVQSELPALVPAATTLATKVTPTGTPAATLLVKKTLPTKCPPVPPLKYNIPAPSLQQQQQQQQQKSLLKSPLHLAQRSGVVTIVDKQMAQKTPHGNKQYTFPLPQTPQTNKISPARQTTPILVSTPSGLQTVHVATTSPAAGTSKTNSPVTATKKLAIKKPIIINHLGPQTTKTTGATAAAALKVKSPNPPQQQKQPQQQQQQPVGNFIIPLEQQQQAKEPQQHILLDTAPKSLTVSAISPRPQMPKNIIRLLPAASNNTNSTTAQPITTSAGATTTKHPTVQIIGPRVLAQTTVRPVQQKIGAVSIVSNKSATNPNTGTGGTIVKMSPQAFATLQQKQLLNKAAATTTGTGTTQQLQTPQRILVGNTAISSNKNIVFQALPTSAASNTGTVQSKLITQPKILTTTTTSTKTLNTANLSPQQQRILLQNFKQQTMQFKPIVEAKSGTPVSSAPATVAVASQTQGTRVARPSVTTATTGGVPQAAQIITLDNLLQKQTASAGKVLTTSNIFQLATSSSSTSVATQVVASPRNVITLATGNATQQRLVTSGATTTKLATGHRIVTTNAMPKIIGKTTVIPGGTTQLQGKPLVLHAKTLNAGGSVTLKNVAASTSTSTTVRPLGGATHLQNIVIGGQTVKLQSATNLPRQVTTSSNSSIPAVVSAPMQTVIMGNQLLRLQHVSTATGTTVTSSTSTTTSLPTASSGIASSPKTLVIGSGGQTLRLQSGKNVIVAAASGGGSGNKIASNITTSSNNVVFAVQSGGGQLFLSPTLQGVNLKPLSNMKVIPMSSATGAKVSVAASSTVVAATDGGGKTLTQKILPQAVLNTGSGSGN